MAQQNSFDIVSEVNFQEVDNAVNQAVKEMKTRYDFRGSKSSIEFLKDEKKIRLIGDDELKLRNLQDILKTRMAARQIPVKSLEFGEPTAAFEGTLRQEVNLIHGIVPEKAKALVQRIKNDHKKVQVSIQGEQLRVTSKSKDDLQQVITDLRARPPEIPLQFVNYR